mgnify:FL=1
MSNGPQSQIRPKGGQEVMDKMVSIDDPISSPNLGNFFGIGVGRLADVIERRENPQEYVGSWRSGKSMGWNNPGNIKWPGSKEMQNFFKKKYGATKSDPTKTGSVFLKFPSYEMGRKALENRLESWSKGPSDYYTGKMTPHEFLKTYVIGPYAKESGYSDIPGFASYLSDLRSEISKGM